MRLVLQTTVPPEEEGCYRYPEVLEELQSQEVLPGHQERILQAPGPHQVQGPDQQVQPGEGDDRETAGEMSWVPCEEVPAEREVGGDLPAEAGQGLDRQEEREEAEGNDFIFWSWTCQNFVFRWKSRPETS